MDKRDDMGVSGYIAESMTLSGASPSGLSLEALMAHDPMCRKLEAVSLNACDAMYVEYQCNCTREARLRAALAELLEQNRTLFESCRIAFDTVSNERRRADGAESGRDAALERIRLLEAERDGARRLAEYWRSVVIAGLPYPAADQHFKPLPWIISSGVAPSSGSSNTGEGSKT